MVHLENTSVSIMYHFHYKNRNACGISPGQDPKHPCALSDADFQYIIVIDSIH